MPRAFRIAGLIGLVAMTVVVLLPTQRTIAEPVSTEGKTVVVELFTSQSCYSCPPAEAFLRELADRPDVIALEFHVDYWDDLVYGAAGKWKDPFSSPMATNRQRLYARHLGSRRYTPQMVVDGSAEGVGSRRSQILGAIKRAKGQGESEIALAAGRTASGDVTVDIEAGSLADDARLWMVTFIRENTNEVLAGENKGKTLTSRNIVRDLVRIDDWDGRPGRVLISKSVLAGADDCAILIQPSLLGPIAGATYCSAPQS